MLYPILNFVAALGKAGLIIMSNIDDPRVDKQLFKNGLLAVNIINKIPINDIINSTDMLEIEYIETEE
jgi:uncharacterized membrane protein (DUF441 family)